MKVVVHHNGAGREIDVPPGITPRRLLLFALDVHQLRLNFRNQRGYGLFAEGGEQVVHRLVEPATLTLRRTIVR